MGNRQSYFTASGLGEQTLLIERSRFICRAEHVHTADEAYQAIKRISQAHIDATHNCYAYIIDANQQKSSDDGEPAGTAGRPILEILRHHQLIQTVVVVTRYYGGIKLGTGGLVRAYQEGAELAIQASGIAEHKLHQALNCQADFALWGKLEHRIHAEQLRFEMPHFTDHVNWLIWVPVEELAIVSEKLIDWFNGQIQIQKGDRQYFVT